MKISRYGFTLIEIVLVVALMAVASTWVLVNYSNQKPTRDLDSAKQKIVAVLRDASARATGESQNTNWGVHLEAGSDTSFFSLFSDTYTTTTRSQFSALPKTVRFDTTHFSGGVQDIVFLRGSGETMTSTTIRLYLVSQPEQSSTIEVYRNGFIQF